MNRKDHITAFYIETLILIVVFVVVILMLTNVFQAARIESVRARRLSDAVILAGNVAEAMSWTEEGEDLLSVLGGEGGAELMPDGRGLTVYYGEDHQADRNGPYMVSAVVVSEEQGAEAESRLVTYEISVKDTQRGEVIYTLRTSVFRKGERS